MQLLFLFSSVLMPQEEAVGLRYPRMTQPHIALSAKSRRVSMLVSNLKTARTTSSLVRSSGVIWDLEGEVH